MIRHAKNPQKSNIDGENRILEQSELTGIPSEETTVSEEAAPSEETLVYITNIVPPARNVSGRMLKERSVLTKNSAVCARLVLIFFAIWLAAAALLPLTSSWKDSEANVLKEWPALTFDDYFSGRYTYGIMERYNAMTSDHEFLKAAGTGIRSFFGPGDPEPVLPHAETSETAVPSGPRTSDQSSDDSSYDVVQSRNYHITNPDVLEAAGHLIVKQDGHWRALSLYEGGDVSVYAGTINYIRQMLDDSINIYVMPIPKAVQFYIPANYADRSADMKDAYRSLTIKLISGITPVDIIEVLNNHNLEPIFLRTDTHWAPLAAYYSAREFTRAAAVAFEGLETYSIRERKDYLGSVYAVTGSNEILNDPETFVYYIPTGSYTADYYAPDYRYLFSGGLFFDVPDADFFHVFLGRDDYIIKVTTDTANGRKLLLVKDSFGNALVPFLTGSFEEIYVVDQSHFDLNLIRFVNEAGITDLLLAQDYDSLTSDHAELLEYITYSNLDAPIEDLAPNALLPADSNPDLDEETYIAPPAPDEIRSEPETTVPQGEPAVAISAEELEPVYEEITWEEDWAADGYEEEYWEDDGYVEEDWADDWYEEAVWEEEGWEEDGWQEEDYVYQEEGYEEPYWDDEN